MVALPSYASRRSACALISDALGQGAAVISEPVFDIKPQNGDAADGKQRQRKRNSQGAEQGSEQNDGDQCPCRGQLRRSALDQGAGGAWPVSLATVIMRSLNVCVVYKFACS